MHLHNHRSNSSRASYARYSFYRSTYCGPLKTHPRAVSCASASRRTLIALSGASSLLCGWHVLFPQHAKAGLLLFPTSHLKNRYLLVRAGESEAEGQNVVLTNPAWKTSLRCGLSERGKRQVVQQALPSLAELSAGQDLPWIWTSITQNSYQSAEIIAYDLSVNRSRIVPEYSFLDARGLGALEDTSPSDALTTIDKGDHLSASWRPERGTDGTPSESVEDVLVRMRQLLSIMETQYRGEDVIIVAPDSDTLSTLQAAVLGVDLRFHRDYAFRPAEVRPLILGDRDFDSPPAAGL